MRFTEIGQQLRAYRLESGLRAEEIAARLGVSRAALYRYEKGEVIKLDTVKRLAELLNISPLSLLGIGMEYYSRPVAFLERLRQAEEGAEQLLLVDGPLCYLITSEGYDQTLAAVYEELAEQAGEGRAAMRAQGEQVLGMLAARKRMYQVRRFGIIHLLTTNGVQSVVQQGLGGGLPLSDALRAKCREVAARELANIAELMNAEPMGLQFGLVRGTDPNGAFQILRSRERATLAMNPFQPDAHPGLQAGVSMITNADEAIAAHQRVAETMWREASKGSAAAETLRQALAG